MHVQFHCAILPRQRTPLLTPRLLRQARVLIHLEKQYQSPNLILPSRLKVQCWNSILRQSKLNEGVSQRRCQKRANGVQALHENRYKQVCRVR